MKPIHREIARLATMAPGTVGVCAQHIETGEVIGLNAEDHFPMASAVKFPVAVWVLALVDQGKLALDQMIEVRPSDLCPGSGMIGSLIYQPGLALSVQNLLELMLVISDNTACDVLLRLAGGPQAVTGYMISKGVAGLRVDRCLKQLVADRFGITGLPAGADWSLERFDQGFDQLNPEAILVAAQRFCLDERDTLTPAGIVELLRAVFAGDLLALDSRSRLLAMMLRCQSGEGALKGMLTPDIAVAHKTGTLAQVVANDVGMISLPGEAGQIAIAVSIQSIDAVSAPASICQKTIAQIARAVFDYFIFAPADGYFG